MLETVMKRGTPLAIVCGGSYRPKELLDVTIDEIGRPYEDYRGFERRLELARENALYDGYAGLRMNLDLKDDTTCKSDDLFDVSIFDVRYSMKIVQLCTQVIVRKKGSNNFIMLKDRT